MSATDTLNLNLNVTHKNQFPPRYDPKIFMNVLSLNIQSLRNKITDLTTFIQHSPHHFHIVVLTETHIRDNETKLFNLPGYEVEHCVRKSGRFGGVSIFVHKEFSTFNLIHKLDLEMNNSLLINLQKYNIRIAAFYRCRDSNFDNFMNRLDYILDNYNNCYIFGDFNLDLCNLNNDSSVKRYHDLISSNGYVFLNSFSKQMATRIDARRNTATCIDHIITDSIFHSNNLSFTVSLDDLFGDHKAMILSVHKSKAVTETHSKFIEIKKIDHAAIISHNLISQAPADSFENFQIGLKKIIEENTIKYRKREKFIKPFMNIETLNYITIKHNYFKLTKKYPLNKMVQERFIFYRKLVIEKVKTRKQEFFHKEFYNCRNNPKETWKNINNLLRNTDSSRSVSCPVIKVNSQQISNKHLIVENFNSFFVTAADNIHTSLQIDPNVYQTLHEFEAYNVSNEFQFPLTSPEEILQILTTLSNSNAEDINGFSNNLFKKYKTSLCYPLSTLINDCFEKSMFPQCLKVAKVKPLFKSGDKTDMNNYRPVAISPIDSKCFESAILSRMEDHLSQNDILCKFQFGYTKNSNCESAVLHVMNQIYSNLEEKSVTSAMFIDLSKAFDSLYHPLLIKKLEKLQFSDKFSNLLISYLSNRSQFVELDNTRSPCLKISKGVFQGSKLAAILFLIYINSIFNLPLNGKLFLYADDIALIYAAPDFLSLKNKMEYDLNVLDIWFTNHYLKMNSAKTNYVLFRGAARLDFFTHNSLNITFGHQTINRVDSFKYLGFIIDEKLDFHKHIQHVKSKIVEFART
jgi:hypothetical protein